MRQFVRFSPPQPYHDNLLLVGLSGGLSAAPPAIARFARARTASVTADAPSANEPTRALSALEWMVQNGRVRRIVSLLPDAPRGATIARHARAEFAAARVSNDDVDLPMAGTQLVELHDTADMEGLRNELAASPGVHFVSRVPIRYLAQAAQKPARKTARVAKPPHESALWNLKKIRWAEARARRGFRDATGIRVAILDSGIDADHPELKTQVEQYVWAHPDYPNSSSAKDIIGHGTHVAGTIGALINGDVGISGVCQCRLNAWKIFDDRPDFDRESGQYVYYVEPVMYLRALAACIAGNVDVINLSIGGGGEPDPVERQLFERLLRKGVTVVAAMGNEREDGSPISYPAALPGVIAVGATGADDRVTTFSNRGSHITLAAPGAGIWSTLPTYEGNMGYHAGVGPTGRRRQGKPMKREQSYAAWDGTSMATPHVTGAVALLLANDPDMDRQRVRARLERSADRVPGMQAAGRDPDYGAGRLNLEKLLK